MKFKPSPKLFNLWIIYSLIILIVVMSPLIVCFFISLAELVIFLSVYLGISVPVFVFVWVWIGPYVRTLEYGIDSDGLILRGGVWWRFVRNIPFHKVTNVQLTQGPIERVLGLSSVSIQTAGHGQSNVPEGKFNGLINAEEVRKEILKHVKKLK